MRQLRTRSWILLGVLAPLGMLAVSGLMLLELRRETWAKAEQTSRNLLQVIDSDIVRTIAVVDRSLLAVIANLDAPGIEDIAPDLRQRLLFGPAATADHLAGMAVLDENGDSVFDADAVPARRVNNADRAYFRAHKADPDLGLHLSEPIVSRVTGTPVIVLSRRIQKPDGSFGGIALGILRLSYFTRLFDRIELGGLGAIKLYRRDGVRILRHPEAGPGSAGAATFARFGGAESGGFVARSGWDGVERQHTFTRVGGLPLVLDVALATREIEAGWRAKALVIGAVVLALCGLAIGLCLLFGRELGRSAAMQAELTRLSRTDPLTGLANRRRFEEAFDEAWDRAARADGGPLSLLIVDADHFKRINDRHGHAAGDAVLRSLARALAASIHRPADLVARVGGEEFAVLLPATDAEGAARVAETIRRTASRLPAGAPGIPAVTVSIGLATGRPGVGAAADLYRRADAALYEAKATGRNRTCSAPAQTEPAGARGILSLVGAA